MRSSFPLVVALLLLPFAPLAACGGNADALSRSLTAYDAGKYDESLTLAQEASASAANTKDSDEAAYLAGMSAFRLNRYDEAIKWLETPARSSDRWTAGQAGITLGSAYLKVGRRSDAARAFAKAGTNLDGEDAKKAHLAAANAYRELGDQSMANEQFRLANVPAPSTPAKTPSDTAQAGSGTVTTPPVTGPFVLQAGAFRDLTKAQRRADELRPKAAKAGLGEPKVLSKRGTDGGTLYVVQLGGFSERRAADAAVAKLGATGVVVGRPAATG